MLASSYITLALPVLYNIVNVKYLERLRIAYKQNPKTFILRSFIVVLALLILLLKRSIWTPDTLLLIVLIIGAVFGKAREFIIRFVPFLGMLIVYDGMRGIADDLNKNVHFWEMIDFDRWIAFGELPTVVLQQAWWHGSVQWYDFYFYFLYTLHFLVPLLVGVALWRFRPRLYWPFVWALVGISFAAFITYVIFPAAPPWMAHELGYFAEPFRRISSDIWFAMGVENFSAVYKNISPNAVAAVPSLHSAYPLIATIFMIRAFGWKRMGWLVLYPLSMWVGVVYIGEHYVFDIVVAIIYVIVGVLAVWAGFKWWRARKQKAGLEKNVSD